LLVSSGHVPVSRFLEILNVAASEEEYLIWNTIDSGLGKIANILDYVDDGGKLKARYNKFIISRLVKVADKLTWTPMEGEDSSVGLLRQVILGRLLKAGHESSKEAALAKFDDYFKNKVELVPDLRGITFAAVGRSNCPERIEQLRELFRTVNFSEIEVQCLSALSQVSDPALLEAQLRWAVLEDGVRNQDLHCIFLGGLGSRVGCELTWDFFKQNMETLLKKYDTVNSSLFQRILKCSIGSHSAELIATEVEKFHRDRFDCDQQKCLERTISQTVEGIRLNAKLLRENTKCVEEFLTAAQF